MFWHLSFRFQGHLEGGGTFQNSRISFACKQNEAIQKMPSPLARPYDPATKTADFNYRKCRESETWLDAIRRRHSFGLNAAQPSRNEPFLFPTKAVLRCSDATWGWVVFRIRSDGLPWTQSTCCCSSILDGWHEGCQSIEISRNQALQYDRLTRAILPRYISSPITYLF